MENKMLPEASLLAKISLGIIGKPLGGQTVLDFYNRMRRENLYNKTFWDAAVEQLKTEYSYNINALNEIPKTGPLILIANHHLGVLDSVGLPYLLSKIRSDFKIMAIEKVKGAGVLNGVKSQLIFVPDKPTNDANGPRAVSHEHLKDGGALILFPSGFLAIAEKNNKYAFDPKWKSGTVALAESTNASILPMYFHSQNSAFYRGFTKLLPVAKHALIMREALNKSGQKIPVSIGRALNINEIPGKDKYEKTDALRSIVYGIGLGATLSDTPYSEMNDVQKGLVDEHRNAIYQHLPEGMHSPVSKFLDNLIKKNI